MNPTVWVDFLPSDAFFSPSELSWLDQPLLFNYVGHTGLVVQNNSNDRFQSLIMLHDPAVPCNEALRLDLRQAEANIEGALSPAKLPIEVVDYPAPRGCVDDEIGAVH